VSVPTRSTLSWEKFIKPVERKAIDSTSMFLNTKAVLLLQLFSTILASPVRQSQIPILHPEDHTQDYEFDPLLHLPGISPYFDAVGFGLQHKAPYGCRVTAASYLIRHAAIYANDDEYDKFIKPFIRKLDKHRKGWSGKLKFMEKWKSPILEDKLEEITPSGAGKSRTCSLNGFAYDRSVPVI